MEDKFAEEFLKSLYNTEDSMRQVIEATETMYTYVPDFAGGMNYDIPGFNWKKIGRDTDSAINIVHTLSDPIKGKEQFSVIIQKGPMSLKFVGKEADYLESIVLDSEEDYAETVLESDIGPCRVIKANNMISVRPVQGTVDDEITIPIDEMRDAASGFFDRQPQVVASTIIKRCGTCLSEVRKKSKTRKTIRTVKKYLENRTAKKVINYIKNKKALKEAYAKKLEESGVAFNIHHLKKEFGLEKDKASAIIKTLRSAKDPYSVEAALDHVNAAIQGYGVVPIKGTAKDSWREPFWADTAAVYVNRGETYKPTVIYDTDSEKFYLKSWGDFVTSLENKGYVLESVFREQQEDLDALYDVWEVFYKENGSVKGDKKVKSKLAKKDADTYAELMNDKDGDHGIFEVRRSVDEKS